MVECFAMEESERGRVIMLDFKEEMLRYKPIQTVDDVEDALTDEIQDMMDILQYISSKTAEPASRPRP